MVSAPNLSINLPRIAYKITQKLRMSEILHIFHQSPTSYYQMHTDAQPGEFQLLNWTSLDSGFPLPFDVTDHFECSEFAETCFGNFSSSSVDELSKVTAVVEQNQLPKKRKLELDVVEVDSGKQSAECDSAIIEPSKAKKRDYIHVRARRGEATDSHSLAERARRERIKKKMQILQDLVPGCNKMSNKAEILDEIITYVQCLQTDVQILTMKLAASTTTLDSKMDNSLPKQQQQQKLEEFSEWQ